MKFLAEELDSVGMQQDETDILVRVKQSAESGRGGTHKIAPIGWMVHRASQTQRHLFAHGTVLVETQEVNRNPARGRREPQHEEAEAAHDAVAEHPPASVDGKRDGEEGRQKIAHHFSTQRPDWFSLPSGVNPFCRPLVLHRRMIHSKR